MSLYIGGQMISGGGSAEAPTPEEIGALPIEGGTLTGDLAAQQITGTTLKSSAATNLGAAATKIAVLDSNGVLRFRTLAELNSDLGNKFAVGTTAPADTTKLWIDTTSGTGGLKYHNGSAWVVVPVAYS